MVVEKILFNPATAVQLPDKFLFKSCAGATHQEISFRWSWYFFRITKNWARVMLE